MPDLARSKRIRILPENEVYDIFARPTFNDDERLVLFELNQEEQVILDSKNSTASSVDLIIQLGYFRAKHQFFKFTLADVAEDVDYVINRFYPDQKLHSKIVSSSQRHRNQQIILQLMKMTMFSPSEHIPLLLEKSQSLCRISNDPLFVFRGLFDFLKNSKITIPSYSTFQEQIISKALINESKRLYTVISLNLLPLKRKLLLSILDESEQFYAITCLTTHCVFPDFLKTGFLV
jgi:hypothetical protein